MSQLRKEIEKITSELKNTLESTLIMTNVQFHATSHYLSMKYTPFNHPETKQLISNCCKESLNKIKQNNQEEITKIEYEENQGTYVNKLVLKQMSKSEKIRLGHQILIELEKDIGDYLTEHNDQIKKYQKLIEKRCK